MSKISWIEIRDKRNRLLASSDWTVMADSPLSESKQNEWKTYRQNLRDLPNNLKSHSDYESEAKTVVDDIWGDTTFPTKPT